MLKLGWVSGRSELSSEYIYVSHTKDDRRLFCDFVIIKSSVYCQEV